MPTFAIGDTDFLLDGAPHRIVSGALHPFRIHPDQWAQRIHDARLMGLNAIEFYVAWNTIEPHRGHWNEAELDGLGVFLDTIAAEGLHAIVRPGPYICAEWANGGLPVWLTATPNIGLRRTEPQYLHALESYLRRVYAVIADRQIDRGGNVILVQIENEYGAYGSDRAYLAELVRITRDAGITVPLTTIDQPTPEMLRDGSLPGVHMTASFGSRATERLATLREHQPAGPLMCMEFWDGWFDWWGGVHHTTDPNTSAAELDALLAQGASVNLYMVHGGTNFATTNGANDKGRYNPIVTSYDYDAPLDEAGRPTAKFHAFREVIARHVPVPDELPPCPAAAPVFTTRLTGAGDFVVGAAVPGLCTFDDLDHVGPLLRHDATLPATAFTDRDAELDLGEVRDMAWIFVDDTPVGRCYRGHHEHTLTIPRGSRLTVIVEDLGRVNYGRRLGEPKGIIGAPTIGGVPITDWTTTVVDVNASAAAAVIASPTEPAGRSALRSVFTLDAQHDLFLDTSGLGKGYAYLNGFALGRYWRNGPQRTLFVPAPVTRTGENTLVLLEFERPAASVAFVAAPMLGETEE